jgi:hypothetical protein
MFDAKPETIIILTREVQIEDPMGTDMLPRWRQLLRSRQFDACRRWCTALGPLQAQVSLVILCYSLFKMLNTII